MVIAVLALEVRAWRAGTRVVTRRQRALRVASAVLLVAIMAMILVGDRWLRESYGLPAAIAYWVFCFGLALSLVVLALLDLKEVGLGYGEDRKRILGDIAKPKGKGENGG